MARSASAPVCVAPLAMRCRPSAAYHATTASASCAFHAATQSSASGSLTRARSSRAAAVARRDEHDLTLGQPHALALGSPPDEDLAALHAVDTGLVVDAL